ncbi:hypothetical protein J4Q44_G00070430 [Coregonus suidteri]|uniref:Uncharacterized protein n=1 Tax=Coregonus suidteri TaxID=861788 RepID=A0AAN8R2J9_9TELE
MSPGPDVHLSSNSHCTLRPLEDCPVTFDPCPWTTAGETLCETLGWVSVLIKNCEVSCIWVVTELLSSRPFSLTTAPVRVAREYK